MIRLQTSIPGGNAAHVSLRHEGDTAVVGFHPAPHGGPETLWFCFRLVDGEGTRQVHLVLHNVHNMLGGGRPQFLRPVLRLDAADWDRLPAPQLIEHPDGRVDARWTIPAPRRHADIACCYPYGREELAALLKQTAGVWHCDTIGVSQGGRPIVRLANDYGTAGSTRPGLYLVARQHSGETPGSWALDGMLRELAERGNDAPMVWAVPLANIDGVEQGDYGKDNFPYDLNRAWGRPPMRHETLVLQQDIGRWRTRCKAALAMDLHAPGACEAEGIYAFLPRPGRFPQVEQPLAGAAETIRVALDCYAAAKFQRTADYPSRWETPNFTAYMNSLGVPGLSIETPYGLAGELLLTREDYQEAGRRIARGILRHLGAA